MNNFSGHQLIWDIIIEKTAFTLKRETVRPLPSGGRIRMSGHIKGYVNGIIEGEFTGVIDGEMGAVVRAKDRVEELDCCLPILEPAADAPGRSGEKGAGAQEGERRNRRQKRKGRDKA